MRNQLLSYPSVLLLAASLGVTACGGGHRADTTAASEAAPAGTVPATPDQAAAPVVDTTPRMHHSVLAGAAVGAVAGHMMGGHAVAGAAAGALIQHERSKHRR